MNKRFYLINTLLLFRGEQKNWVPMFVLGLLQGEHPYRQSLFGLAIAVPATAFLSS